MNLISRQKTLFPNKKSVKEFLNKPQAKKCPIIWDKKMVSFVNLSVEGDQQIKEKKVFSSLGNRLIKKRKNIRELGEKRNEFDKRKLVFLTEGMNNK